MSTEPIIIKQACPVPLDTVWMALTDKDQMTQWFFDAIPSFEPEIGFETEFVVECEGVEYRHQWKVTEVIPGARIVYGWRYGGYPGDSFVRWDLSETPGGTLLRFAHEQIETFPGENPVFSRESTQAGWDYLINESLKNFLSRRTS